MTIEIKDEKKFARIVSDAIESAVTNCATDALATRWTNAINRAVTEIETNPFLSFDETHKSLLICSPSNKIYSANGVCQCKAFELGQPCWHRAAARIVRRYLEAEAQTEHLSDLNNAPYLTVGKKAEYCGNIRI